MTPRRKVAERPQRAVRRRPDELGAKAKAFIREYCLCLDTAEAQRKVGYEIDRGNAARILNDPRAAAELRRNSRKATELAEIHQAWILSNVKKIAGVNVYKQLRYDETGHFEGVDVSGLTEDQVYAISEIGFDGDGRPKIKFHDKPAALRMLNDHLTPPKPQRVQLEGKNGGPVEVIDGLGARLNAARQRVKGQRSGS